MNMGILDKLPLATIVFLVGLVLIVIAYLSDDLSIEESLEAIGFVGLGSGAIGIARNGSGRGLRNQ